jgi:hypothetical protein
MAAKKNAAAHDLRTPKYRLRVVKNRKKAYLRRPKHAARAAESFSAPALSVTARRRPISADCARRPIRE